MCFLCGGLRFREQVCRAYRRGAWRARQADDPLDLQQYRDSNERVSAQSERYESTSTRMSSPPYLARAATQRHRYP